KGCRTWRSATSLRHHGHRYSSPPNPKPQTSICLELLPELRLVLNSRPLVIHPPQPP
uniref:TAP binding protein like n=1 Tax=Macaca fascicularis TaxID=9541 RepID=A0A7N9D7G2_MACFA